MNNRIEKLIFNYIVPLKIAIVSFLHGKLQHIGVVWYILKNGCTAFPYPSVKHLGNIESGIDEKNGLPYVIHNGKRLYYPKDTSVSQAVCNYRFCIEQENILGGNYKNVCPHQYQTEHFYVEKGDVFADVGAAEGLVALDVIEKVNHAYIFEADSRWMPALKATFAPYAEKVTIINKYVSGKDTDTTITLQTVLQGVTDSRLFIKMDIEGAEVETLMGAEEFLMSRNIKLACCTYHKAGDAKAITDLMNKWNYKWEYSDGVMLFSSHYPFFRKGLIRAKNY